MNWLWKLLQKVGRFLSNSIEAFTVLAKKIFDEAINHISVSLNAGIPPSVSFGMDAGFIAKRETWEKFSDFTKAIWEQMEKLVESTAI